MGLCGASLGLSSGCHLTIFSSANSQLPFTLYPEEIWINDFLLTESGYLLAFKDRKPSYVFAKRFVTNSLTSTAPTIYIDVAYRKSSGNTVCLRSCSYINDLDRCLWRALSFSIDNHSDRGFELSQQNMVRIGEVPIFLRFLVPEGKSSQTIGLKNYAREEGEELCKNIIEADHQSLCCQCGGRSSYGDELVSFCDCGQNALYHVSCLKSWVNKFGEVKSEQLLTEFSLERLFCPKCKGQIPSILKSSRKNGYIFPFELPIPDRPMALIEILDEKDYERVKKIVAIDIGSDALLTFGRLNSNDIILDNYSVSPIHGFFRVEGRKLLIHDHHSNYGTWLREAGETSLSIGTSSLFRLGNILVEVRPFKGYIPSYFKKKSWRKNPFTVVHELVENEGYVPESLVLNHRILGNLSLHLVKENEGHPYDPPNEWLESTFENQHSFTLVVKTDKRKLIRQSLMEKQFKGAKTYISLREVLLQESPLGSSLLIGSIGFDS